jgi:hypothetical protein
MDHIPRLCFKSDSVVVLAHPHQLTIQHNRQRDRTLSQVIPGLLGSLLAGACLCLSCHSRRKFPIFVSNSRHEKLLDDTEALLYCDPEFHRQLVISLS